MNVEPSLLIKVELLLVVNVEPSLVVKVEPLLVVEVEQMQRFFGIIAAFILNKCSIYSE